MATYNGMTKAKSNFHLGIFICTGAAASTGMTCTGITVASTIIAAFHISTAASIATMAQVDLDAVTNATAGEVEYTTDISNDQLLVFWTDDL
ncbi:hypothetical protein KAT92_05025 [Candidatus Babeliales bacterium]|nr:hypothetical protein [Candidatus Babeliales bacterium]